MANESHTDRLHTILLLWSLPIYNINSSIFLICQYSSPILNKKYSPNTARLLYCKYGLLKAASFEKNCNESRCTEYFFFCRHQCAFLALMGYPILSIVNKVRQETPSWSDSRFWRMLKFLKVCWSLSSVRLLYGWEWIIVMFNT